MPQVGLFDGLHFERARWIRLQLEMEFHSGK